MTIRCCNIFKALNEFVFHIVFALIAIFAITIIAHDGTVWPTLRNMGFTKSPLVFGVSIGYVLFLTAVCIILRFKRLVLCKPFFFWPALLIPVLLCCYLSNCFWTMVPYGDAPMYWKACTNALPKAVSVYMIRCAYALRPWTQVFGLAYGVIIGNMVYHLMSGVNIYWLAKFSLKNEYIARVACVLYFIIPVPYFLIRVPQIDLFGLCGQLLVINFTIFFYGIIVNAREFKWKFWLKTVSLSLLGGFLFLWAARRDGLDIFTYLFCIAALFIVLSRTVSLKQIVAKARQIGLVLAFLLIVPLAVHAVLNKVILTERVPSPQFETKSLMWRELGIINPGTVDRWAKAVLPQECYTKYTIAAYVTAFQKVPDQMWLMWHGKMYLLTSLDDSFFVFNPLMKKKNEHIYDKFFAAWKSVLMIFRIFFGVLLLFGALSFFKNENHDNLLSCLAFPVIILIGSAIMLGECRGRYIILFYWLFLILAGYAFSPNNKENKKPRNPVALAVSIGFMFVGFAAVFYFLHTSDSLAKITLQPLRAAELKSEKETYEINTNKKKNNPFLIDEKIPKKNRDETALTAKIPLTNVTPGKKYAVWGYFYGHKRQRLSISVNGSEFKDITGELKRNDQEYKYAFLTSVILEAGEENYLTLKIQDAEKQPNDKYYLKLGGVYLDPVE